MEIMRIGRRDLILRVAITCLKEKSIDPILCPS